MIGRRSLLLVVCLGALAAVGAGGLHAPAAAEESGPSGPPAAAPDSSEAASGEIPTRPREARSPAGLEVLRAYVCEGIEESEPAEAGMSFLPGEGAGSSLCCFTEMALPAGRDSVVHVWRWGDREMARIPLEVRAPRWRTWSVKRVQDDWRGGWSVDVTDRSGFLLMRLSFSVE